MTTPAQPLPPLPDTIATVLKLVVAQLQAAQSDNDTAMLSLAQAHGDIAQQLSSIAAELSNGINAVKPPSEHNPHSISRHLGRMTVAFQEHDALNQRLAHTCASLELLAQRLEQLGSSNMEIDLLEAIRTSYTMREERAVFETVVNGDASQADTTASEETRGDDIELF